MNNLLIGSVYAQNERSQFWYDTQINFIKKTTQNFHHIVYNNNSDVDFKYSEIIPQLNVEKAKQYNSEHLVGLNAIIDYFINSNFEKLLILDSDAFPIKDWQRILEQRMKMFAKSYAAVMRVENLDLFAHPCVFYTNKKLSFKFEPLTLTNLVGTTITDIGCDVDFMPLLRSNKTNFHCMLGGIYYDSFYHHGSGSRYEKHTRSEFLYYYDSGSNKDIDSYLFNYLKTNPEKYINILSCGKGMII